MEPVKLRPYQSDAIQQAREAIARGITRILICAPTGAGKTVIAAAIVQGVIARKRRAVFIAHRRELIKQGRTKMLEANIPSNEVAVLLAGEKGNAGASVQICGIDTINARGTYPPAHLVITDECHRAVSPGYQRVHAQYPAPVVHIGLTATPERLDGRGLKDAYDHLIIVATPRQLITDGFILEPEIRSHPPAGIERVKEMAGEFNEKELEKVVNRPKLLGEIVEHWVATAQSDRTVVFAVNRAHSRAIVERFVEAGIAAEHLDGSMKTTERDAILARLESGETLVVSNCDVLTEGWDMPSVKVLVDACPTMSLVRYLQRDGRILRPWNGRRALILDHAGNALRHGRPQKTREWSLEGREKRAKGEVDPDVLGIKICPQCFLTVEREVMMCPDCSYLWPVPKTPGEGDGNLVLLDHEPEIPVWREPPRAVAGNVGNARVPLNDEMRAAYADMLRNASFRQLPKSVATQAFRKRFGGWPTGATALEERYYGSGGGDA